MRDSAKHRDPDPPARAKAVQATFPSDYPHAMEVQRRVIELCESLGFRDSSLFAIKLSLEEALVNAVKHGNKLDPAKKVKVHAKVTPARFEITIEDEGAGFDRVRIADPREEENLCKCTGRGILLIESYMDSAKWTHSGRRLRMTKMNTEAEKPKKPPKPGKPKKSRK